MEKKLCSIQDCDNPYYGRSYCNKHYTRLRRNGDALTVKQMSKSDIEICIVDSCDQKYHAQGYCKTHYSRMYRYGHTDIPEKPKRKYNNPLCNVVLENGQPCKNKRSSLGMCASHYSKFYRHGSPLADKRPPASPTNYVSVVAPKDHPNARRDGYIFEHRLVMSEHLKRPLLGHENVHHKNGNRKDNRIENLELWSKWQPPGQRISDKIDWAIELLQLYAPDKLKEE